MPAGYKLRLALLRWQLTRVAKYFSISATYINNPVSAIKNNCMKPLVIMLFTLIVTSVISCKKGNEVPVDFNLTGKWTYKEYGYSIGGPMIWEAPSPVNQAIEFKEDGTFIPAESFLKGTTRYQKSDSVTLQFSPAQTPTGFIKMGYAIDSVSGILSLWPVDPACIEGCGNRFVRRNN